MHERHLPGNSSCALDDFVPVADRRYAHYPRRTPAIAVAARARRSAAARSFFIQPPWLPTHQTVTGVGRSVDDSFLTIDGIRVPRFLYGTAWKEENTQRLTALALESGFRGIDTANQRRHYHEVAVGHAIAATISRGLISRGDVFLQTKFTFQRGQDHRL